MENPKPRAITYLVLLLLLGGLASCCSPLTHEAVSSNKAAPDLHHIVLIWFQDADDKARWIDEARRGTYALKNISGLKTLHVGAAVPSERKIVDDSFDLGIHMTFASTTEMNAYLINPAHVEFVKNIKPHIKKLLVYDF